MVMNSETTGIPQDSGEVNNSDHRKFQDLSTTPENIVVAVKAGREISKTALAWALTHVVRPGDCITLLAVFPGENRGRKLWSFPKFAGDCASGHRKSTTENSPERKCQITDSCSQMMLQFHGVYDQNKINVKVKIVCGSPAGGVALESKRAGANWVVLDRQLKQEERRCMEELQCNIVVMKRSTPKVLRLNLAELKSPKPQASDSSCPKESQVHSQDKRAKPSTPDSIPEEELKTPFTATSEAANSSLSSSDIGASPFFISERNPLFDGFHKGEPSVLREEEEDFDEAVTAFDSDCEGASPLSSHQTNHERENKDSSATDLDLFLQITSPCATTQAKTNIGDTWVAQNHGEQIQIMRNNIDTQTTKPPTSKNLLQKFSEFDQIRDENQRRDPFYRSSVRDAVSLCRSSPPVPPPLCSICQHKAPVFGKPPRWFSYEELEIATGGFSEANFLAEGGFGSVHRGILEDGQAVAVKQLRVASSQGDAEFCAEVEVLSCAQHRNVVLLIGFCIEEKRRLLVYEYVCNASLDFHLYGSSRAPLGWNARQKIAVGAARGLRYLHEDCRVGCIIHRDMRPNNILITHDFEPLVGDFGLARWQPDGDIGEDTRIIGTFGYLAPEYTQSGKITEKADVYAFGVVLVELITGRRAVDMGRPKGQQLLAEWARPLLEEGPAFIHKLVDPHLDPRLVGPQFHSMIYAASLCLRRDPHTRPRMSKVLKILEGHSMMDPCYSNTPGFDVEHEIGNRSGRMISLSLHATMHGQSSPRFDVGNRSGRRTNPNLHEPSEQRFEVVESIGNRSGRMSGPSLREQSESKGSPCFELPGNRSGRMSGRSLLHELSESRSRELVGSRSGRMSGLSVHGWSEHVRSPRSESGGNHSRRLSQEALKAVYCERGASHSHICSPCL